MSIDFDKSLILRKIKMHLSFKKDTEFASFLGIKPTTLSSWYSRNTYDSELLYAKCGDLSPEWLLTGKGNMLAKEKTHTNYSIVSEPKTEYKRIKKTNPNPSKDIPLLPIEAMAGFGTGENQALEIDCERYVIPAFKGAEFLIQVKGSSMYPKYNSGDIVACKKLPMNDLFFQWNKVYVLDTIQGALIKRIKQGKDPNHILIISDNPSYEPFELHKSQIHTVAIVMGVIRLE